MSDIGSDSQVSPSVLIQNIVEDLFSYNTGKRKNVLEYYFFEQASLSSPLMSTEGVMNIQYVYTVWQAMNRSEPTINNIVFDGRTAVVHLTQNISPCIFPSFIQLKVPAITTLHFRETDQDSGLLKIYRQEDSWTLEGLLQSVPLISFWYDHVLRLIMGKIVAATGDLLDAAIQQSEIISQRGQDIQRIGRDMAIENMEKLDEYKSDLHENYLKGIKNWRESCILDEMDDYGSDIHPQSSSNLIKEPGPGRHHQHLIVEDVD